MVVEGRDRRGWDDLESDKERLYKMLTNDKEKWSDVVQSAMEGTDPANMTIWAFHTLSKLNTWYSPRGRVIIIGDGAHAIPPIAGQGANQAFEDAYTLAWLLHNKLENGAVLVEMLATWQSYRQGRIAKVMELNRKMGNMRLPTAERERLQINDGDFGAPENMDWLFAPEMGAEMEKLFG